MATGTTIAEKLEDVVRSRDAIFTVLRNKGITVPTDAKLTDVADLIKITPVGIEDYLVAWEANRSSITSLAIPSEITTIGSGAFWGAAITSLTIPTTIRTIYKQAFYQCTKLATLYIEGNSSNGAGCETIGESAFQGCTSLTTARLSYCLSRIEKQAFYGCTKLTSIEGHDINYIGISAFQGCTSLTTVELAGNNVGTIEMYAFSGCTALKTLTIHGSGTLSLNRYALSGVPSSCAVCFPNASESTLKAKSTYPFGIATGTKVTAIGTTFTV